MFLNLYYSVQRNIRRSLAPILFELTSRKKQEKNRKPVIRNTFLEWNRDSELYAFNQRLSEKFDTVLLEQALTHRYGTHESSLLLISLNFQGFERH